MEADGKKALSSLKVDGGASANNFLMQFQADIMGIPVIRPACVETTALGAAYLAGLSSGFWKDRTELKECMEAPSVFEPSLASEERKKLISGWKKAVGRTFDWEK